MDDRRTGSSDGGEGWTPVRRAPASDAGPALDAHRQAAAVAARMPKPTRQKRSRPEAASKRQCETADARSVGNTHQPLTQTTWRKVCTTSTRSVCAAITA